MSVVVGRWTYIFSISLTVLISFALFSNALEPMLSILEYFNAADSVVLAQIDGQEVLREGEEQCGIRYEATILKSLKGWSDEKNSNKIIFGRYAGLKTYRTYLLFLNYESDVVRSHENMVEQFGFYDKRSNIMELVACKGTVPGYTFNRKLKWEVISHDVYLSGLLPKEIPPSIHVFQTGDGAEWRIPLDDLFQYLRTPHDDSVRPSRAGRRSR
jgi:hypothetical protein